MKAARLRRACLSHAGATEEWPFGPENSVFKVGGKMFALSRLDNKALKISLKCEPEIAERLRGAHPEIIPGYHLNKRHWNTVDLAGALPDQMVLDMIEDSYDLVVASLPKKARERLHWTAVVDEASTG